MRVEWERERDGDQGFKVGVRWGGGGYRYIPLRSTKDVTGAPKEVGTVPSTETLELQ